MLLFECDTDNSDLTLTQALAAYLHVSTEQRTHSPTHPLTHPSTCFNLFAEFDVTEGEDSSLHLRDAHAVSAAAHCDQIDRRVGASDPVQGVVLVARWLWLPSTRPATVTTWPVLSPYQLHHPPQL